ncbi:MAG: peptidase [Nitrospirae bacterium CG18_big_fil_WC_8_21_14_2_50_70_55]|nr:MAG: peptidase [Nitrospirae bacterium CG18_big_fil_WC_8_21_14_2_50_70_55]PIU79755.1 MAG: peptidase [Nitrospirae bacterium CG06_land_8_20_14_3_00_70_43]PIW82403.1 MAG: peptidase [Nitrospirae bacterium CG_4_8_14_3_um_filter_70_85]PIX82127.1 MAG: peptidase [Nitrospirae bacterium CG_4_10_14_3_um_filter_70_108]PJB95214.1 MAG: peptidase [Nitrospirae bacterium CG_4_9_14_0_8_um_filter_70_14]
MIASPLTAPLAVPRVKDLFMARLLVALVLSLATTLLPRAVLARPFWQDGSGLEVPNADSPLRWDTFTKLAEQLRAAVVNVATTETVRHPTIGPGHPGMGGQGQGQGQDPFQEFFRRFFEGQPGFPGAPPHDFKRRSLGSGFIIAKEGYIITNNHVVENADKVTVRLDNEHEFEAVVVGRDPKTDVALLKIETKENLFAAPLGDSEKLNVGEWVMAIGNPFGLAQTVTTGIVSAKGRVIGAGPYDNFIQTDASINPGNSGGPLFNIRGEVVGINTAIISGGTGIGFAVPVNMAKEVIEQLKEHGKVVRGWVGVYIQEITDELQQSLELKERGGVLVADVVQGSPAADAGLRRSDVIVSFDGKPVHKAEELPRLVALTPVGKKVAVEVIRDGARKTLELKVGVLAEEEAEGATTPPNDLGITLQEITPELADSLGLEEEHGLVVSDIDQDGPAWEAGMRRGDVVIEVNRKAVATLADFRDSLAKRDKARPTLFLVKRAGNTLYFGVKR